MQTQLQVEQKSLWQQKKDFYLSTGMIGVFRGFVGLPLEHPFDVLKTRLQSSSILRAQYKNNIEIQEFASKSMIKNWYQIYQQFGFFRGIYAGYIPNLFRVCSKQFYRFPMMIYFPTVFQKIIPQHTQEKYDGIHKISAGLLIAVLESVIMCPFERLKVFMMTKHANQSAKYKNIFQQNKNKSIAKELYKGLDVLLYRQMVSWCSFLYLDYKVKKEFKQYRGIEMNESLKQSDLISASVLIGVINVLTVQPLDKIKTLYQMQNNDKFQQRGLIQNVIRQYQRYGVGGFYQGLKPRMTHYIINALFTCQIIEKLELAVQNKGLIH